MSHKVSLGSLISQKFLWFLCLFKQNERPGEQPQLSEVTGTSLSERLRHLKRLIRSTKEEEAASQLRLLALLDMVDI